MIKCHINIAYLWFAVCLLGLFSCQVEEELVIDGWKPIYQGEANLTL